MAVVLASEASLAKPFSVFRLAGLRIAANLLNNTTYHVDDRPLHRWAAVTLRARDKTVRRASQGAASVDDGVVERGLYLWALASGR